MKTTDESAESLFARQKEMENHAMALGGQRFRAKLEKAVQNGDEAGVGAAKKLLSEGLLKVETGMKELMEAAGNRSQPKKWARLLGADVAAYLALKVVLDNIHGRISLRKATTDVTELIIDELRARRFAEKQPKLFEYVMTSFTTSNYAHRARSIDARIHREEIDVSDLVMTQTERFNVGLKFLEVVMVTTGLVKAETTAVPERSGKVIHLVELVATEETLTWLKEGNEALENLWPVNLPMVMPPLPWAPGKPGGYRFALMGKHKLVRSNNAGHREQLKTAHMPAVYNAVNQIQATPWRINSRIREVVQQLFFTAGGGCAGLPLASDEKLPSQEGFDMNDVVQAKAWRKKAHAVHEANHDNRVGRKALFDLWSVVELMKDEQAIWFPHTLDFRGRVYPVTSYLHPQGSDMVKALLQFTDGKALGEDGARYLANHGAQALDKTFDGRKLGHMSMDERVAYIESIGHIIVAIAADPIGNRQWEDAGEPWQFLAFCFDYAGYIREGASFVSHLAVAMDGTCNGLQHFAALWLDEKGAEAVNVKPSASGLPQDIYNAVAVRVKETLTTDGDPLAAKWLASGLVDRSLCKRPVMTFGYGSEKFGFSQQLFDKMKEVAAEKTEKRALIADLFTEDVVDEETGEVKAKSSLFRACSLLAGHIWDALEAVCVSAFDGMAWMRKSARVVSKDARKCVEWTVPGTGFPVRQSYMEQTDYQIKTQLAGAAYKPRVYSDTETPNWKKQTSSVAPNIVHSLDAAALMLTVNQAAANGIEHFAMIHDSYGTLAADAAVLAAATRSAFVSLYTQRDVVAELHSQFMKQVDGCEDAELPVPPSKGSLDIGVVLVSQYFFS